MTSIPHSGFIAAAFAITAVVLVAMIGAVLWDYRDLKARLARLEEPK